MSAASDWDETLARQAQDAVRMEKSCAPSIDTIRTALNCIPADNRDTWLRMSMAIKSEFGDEGFTVWDDWSRPAGNYDPNAASATWKSIKDRLNGDKKPITIGSLLHEARKHGWDGSVRTVSPEETAARQQANAERAAREEAKTAENRKRAESKATLIKLASTTATAKNPYLKRKRVKPVVGLLEIDLAAAVGILGYQPKSKHGLLTGRLLAVPVTVDGKLTTIELIDGEARKSAIHGGRKVGGYWPAQPLPDGDGAGLTLLIGEGVATVLSASEVTKHPVVAALSDSNLMAVAKAMRNRYPAAALVVLADLVKATGAPDPHAIKAARAVGGLVAVPAFGDDRPEGATDFNDLARIHGAKAVAEQIDAAQLQGGSEALEAARREHQKRENEQIGEGGHKVPTAEVVTLDEALERFVFLSDGSRVADIYAPNYDLAFSDWARAIAASKIPIGGDGTPAKVAGLWLASKERKTVVERTFLAGGPIVLKNPKGIASLNTWRPYDRTVEADSTGKSIRLFLGHVSFLFPSKDDRERFLDWLAHIEQQPGDLPHTAWLHVARHPGLGRNWLASVLARVWAGSVAANLDLTALLESGFNGRLSRKVLAVVDEIREGGRDDQWKHAERLKSLITEEHRSINPKYARQSVEYNACRWLLFSNHVSALPIPRDDRRIEVAMQEEHPKPADYYSKIYAALRDPKFIASIAQYLGQRNIHAFNPGAHARDSEARRSVITASQTDMSEWCELLINHWPCDVALSAVVQLTLLGSGDPGRAIAAYRRTLEEHGAVIVKSPISIDGKSHKITILRNAKKWKAAEPSRIRAELKRGVGLGLNDLLNPREFLLELVAR